MIVPSIIAYSKSGSPDSTLKIFSKTPLSAQRRNRFQTENHLPKYAGRSRQGEPVRAIHRPPPGTGDCLLQSGLDPLSSPEQAAQSVPIAHPSTSGESRLTSIFQP